MVPQGNPESGSWYGSTAAPQAEEHLLLTAKMLLHTGGEWDIPCGKCWNSHASVSTAKTGCREEKSLSPCCWSWSAHSPSVWPCPCHYSGEAHRSICFATWITYIQLHLCLWITAGCPGHPEPPSAWPIPCLLPLSTVVPLPGWHTASSLKGFLPSHPTPVTSRGCALCSFPNRFAIAPLPRK